MVQTWPGWTLLDDGSPAKTQRVPPRRPREAGQRQLATASEASHRPGAAARHGAVATLRVAEPAGVSGKILAQPAEAACRTPLPTCRSRSAPGPGAGNVASPAYERRNVTLPTQQACQCCGWPAAWAVAGLRPASSPSGSWVWSDRWGRGDPPDGSPSGQARWLVASAGGGGPGLSSSCGERGRWGGSCLWASSDGQDGPIDPAAWGGNGAFTSPLRDAKAPLHPLGPGPAGGG
jgi:hypothetical protein